jgi:hypothetical protein
MTACEADGVLEYLLGYLREQGQVVKKDSYGEGPECCKGGVANAFATRTTGTACRSLNMRGATSKRIDAVLFSMTAASYSWAFLRMVVSERRLAGRGCD